MGKLTNLVRTAFVPLAGAVFGLRCRLARYEKWHIRNCYFYGPTDFLGVCSRAMELLLTLDCELYESVASRKLVSWYEPNGPVFFKNHCGISKAFIGWQEHGVIACLLYSYFAVTLGYEGKEATQSASLRILNRVRSWLKDHTFPPELLSCFDSRRTG